MTQPAHDTTVGNDLGEVSSCDCGGVNLTLGFVTLHLSAEEVGMLDELVSRAVELVASPGKVRRLNKKGTVH